MSRLNEFAAALLPDTWTVLGRRLQPFSMGHALLFKKIGLLFEPDLLPDFVLAVELCARSFRHAEILVQRRISPGWLRWRMLCASVRRHRIQAEYLTWKYYVRQAFIPPPTEELPQQASLPESGKPWLADHVCALMKNYHLSLDAALATPVRVAMWLNYIGAEGISFVIQRDVIDEMVMESLKAQNG